MKKKFSVLLLVALMIVGPTAGASAQYNECLYKCEIFI